MSFSLEKSKISIKVVVVGGNVGGLAAAFALKLAGHDVLAVLEKTDGCYQSFGGIQSPPGMTKTLYRWGLEKDLQKLAHKCSLLVFRNGGSNSTIGSIAMDQDFLEDLLAEFLFIQHQSLCDLLYELVIEAGIPVLLNTEATDVEICPVHARVKLSNGNKIEADLVIGADGFNSPLRCRVTNIPDEDAKSLEMKHLHLTFSLPTEILQADKDLNFLLESTTWPLWLGDGYTIHMNITTDGQSLTATLTYYWDHELLPEDSDWATRPIEYYQLDMNKFEQPLRKLLGLVNTVSARVIVTRPVPDDLVCPDSRILLVGEAAHPLVPGANHRTSMVIEDAETLRSIFSRMEKREQLSKLLGMYEEIRLPRCKSVVAYDHQFHQMVQCPAGSEMVIRDNMLRETMICGDWDHMDEAAFRLVWREELMMWAYDATEEVDSYWSHYGQMMNHTGKTYDEDGNDTGDTTPTASPAILAGLRRVSVSYQSLA